jgi:hypothetical protein
MSRIWSAVAALAVVSLLGDFLCTRANSVDTEKLMQAGSSCVGQLPDTIGEWHVIKSEPLGDEVLRMLRCRNHENRVYVNDRTGDEVSLVLLVGEAGPLLAHTPEVCYSSAEWDTIEPAHFETIRGTGDTADNFFRVTVSARNLTNDRQRIYYGWRSGTGPWQAPRNPRIKLGGEPMLYKLQLVARNEKERDEGDAVSPDAEATRSFLEDLLPVLDELLKTP